KDLTKAEKAMEGKRVKIPDEKTDLICEVCGKPLVIKIGKYGKFLACSGFPECTNTKTIVIDTGGICPFCGKKVLQKKSKRGKKFFGCEDNPNCSFMTWDAPVKDTCPECKSTLFHKGGKSGTIVCHKPDCEYERAYNDET
ncbi:MAG: DNA topoisomerase I, partial [Clostridiales bacterium]|nr:DNA topoisomerase I [Clostridiales bacterium]